MLPTPPKKEKAFTAIKNYQITEGYYTTILFNLLQLPILFDDQEPITL